MAYKFANTTATVYDNGMRLQLAVDDIWDASDPFVKSRPDLFNDQPVLVHATIEQATAAPGETRTTKRVTKKA
ncbi:MAG: hypothetical protein NWS14_03205 [Pontimonas sp.]|nr:hypothetical protein [Pontimonas sp.]